MNTINKAYHLGGARVITTIAIALVALGILSACATSTTNGSTVRATNTSGGNVAAKVCPTPSTGAPQDMLAFRACQAIGNLAETVQAAYNAQDASVTVTVRVGGKVPDADNEVSAAQEMTKTICLRAQQAMWTSGVALKEVTVTVLGPIQDEYAEIVDGAYGAAVLDVATAKRLDLASLSAATAWDKYNNVFLRPYYVLFD
ncbi:MAG: hypothetical protein ACM3N4_13150 [Nitrososphaerota archaeon]